MKEFKAIIEQLKLVLAAKVEEVNKQGNIAIPFVLDSIKSRQIEVADFEQSIMTMETSGPQRAENIAKFRRDAHELSGEISKILV